MVDIIGESLVIMTNFGIFAILAVSLNLEYGYAGQPNFGQVAFYGIGSFAAAWVSTLLLLTVGYAIPPLGSSTATIEITSVAAAHPLVNGIFFILALGVGALVAGGLGFAFCYPSLRLRGDFLAITLLVFAEIFTTVIYGIPQVSGGDNGAGGVTTPFIFVNDITLRYFLFAVTVWLVVAAIFVYSRKLANSPYARVLKSIRDDQTASANLGKPTSFYKAQILIVGSAFAGVAGVLYTYYSGAVQADSFQPIITFTIWVMVIVGGSGSIKGSIIGAGVVTAISQGTTILDSFVVGSPILGRINFDYVGYLIYAILIIVVLMFRSKGISGEKPVDTVAWTVVDGKDKKT